MGEIDYEEVFGVEAGGDQEAEVEQEPADLEGSEEENEPEEVSEPGEKEEQEEGSVQEPEDNRYAEFRRHAEEEARKQAEQEVNALIASSGFTDPYTQKPIASLQDLRAYREQYEQDRRKEFQEGHNMTDREYQAYVDGLPEVQAARAAAQKAAAEGAKARLEQDLQEVRKLDPNVKGLEDLAQSPEYSQICGLVEKGLSLPEAYKLVHFDDLTQRTAEATRQAALNAVNGKQHLHQTTVRGDGAASIPSDVAEEYRMFMPEASEAEIQAHYNAYAKAHMRQ